MRLHTSSSQPSKNLLKNVPDLKLKKLHIWAQSFQNLYLSVDSYIRSFYMTLILDSEFKSLNYST